MSHVRRATTNDVPLLLPLVAAYWAFEDIPGFDVRRVSAQLARLLGEPRLGCGWIALVDDVPAGYQLSRDNDSARAFYHRHGYTERSAYELLDKVLHNA